MEHTTDWLELVQHRMKKRYHILFRPTDPLLEELRNSIEAVNHRTAILWALELAEEAADTLEAHLPGETRPRAAVEVSRLWAAGRAKMPLAQREILRCHALAKELDSPEDIALCHAVGQACGVVHTAGHAMGFPIYELTALVRRYGPEACREPVEARLQQLLQQLQYWRDSAAANDGEWASFLPQE